MFRNTIAAVLAAAMLTGCMGDREYQLRKRQLQNQAAHPPTYELFTVSGPFKLELAEGGAAKVAPLPARKKASRSNQTTAMIARTSSISARKRLSRSERSPSASERHAQ